MSFFSSHFMSSCRTLHDVRENSSCWGFNYTYDGFYSFSIQPIYERTPYVMAVIRYRGPWCIYFYPWFDCNVAESRETFLSITFPIHFNSYEIPSPPAERTYMDSFRRSYSIHRSASSIFPLFELSFSNEIRVKIGRYNKMQWTG